MWVRNGAETLPLVLERIDEVIPHEAIGQKILVDDRSTDDSVEIAKEFNWDVYENREGGIGCGANTALSKVRTDLFISVEQDVLLNRDWYDRISRHMARDNVAVAQGWRLSTNPTIRAFETFGVEHLGADRLYSIDNNVYDTKVIRALGGFPTMVRYHVDAVLRSRVRDAGYAWLTDMSVVSTHIRRINAFRWAWERNYRIATEYPMLIRDRLLSPDEAIKLDPVFQLVKTVLSLPIGGYMAMKTGCPQLALFYPVVRLAKLVGHIKGLVEG